jgi:hypothetical protein
MRRWILLAALGLPLATAVDAGAQGSNPQRQGPPHEWAFGMWTGGQFPPGDTDTPACFGGATVIFTRDVVMRVSALDTAYRQRTIETVAQQPNGLEFRFTPAQPMMTAFGGRVPPDAGFGCGDNPNLLRVERRGPDEVVFPDCREFPSPLKRCTTK